MDPARRPDDWIGRTVEIVIDRPLGSVHPRHPDLVYPLNYGYIPGTMAPDGHPLDVYVLGPAGPVETCTATVIAIIRRRDDAEDKLVAVTNGSYSADQISEATSFQERWFDSYVEMGSP